MGWVAAQHRLWSGVSECDIRRPLEWGQQDVKPLLHSNKVYSKLLNLKPVLATAVQDLTKSLYLHYVKHVSIKAWFS